MDSLLLLGWKELSLKIIITGLWASRGGHGEPLWTASGHSSCPTLSCHPHKGLHWQSILFLGQQQPVWGLPALRLGALASYFVSAPVKQEAETMCQALIQREHCRSQHHRLLPQQVCGRSRLVECEHTPVSSVHLVPISAAFHDTYNTRAGLSLHFGLAGVTGQLPESTTVRHHPQKNFMTSEKVLRVY